MPVTLRILMLICQLIIVGLGILMAVNRLYGMAFLFALMLWCDRPEILRLKPR